MTAKNGSVGIHMTGVARAIVDNCQMTNNVTGLELTSCYDVAVSNCAASANTQAGFSLISSTTNVFTDCAAFETGQFNSNVISNNVFGFVSQNGVGNIFERCIANATQALSTTDYNSVVAGFALRGSESCSKIIDSEAANSATSASGVTVPYGIFLEGTLTGLVSVTALNPEGGSYSDKVRSVNWSPDGEYVAIGGNITQSGGNGDAVIVYQFNRTAGSLMKVVGVNPGGGTYSDNIRSINWSPDGLYLAVGGQINGLYTDDFIIYQFDRTSNTLSQVAAVAPGGSTNDTILSVNWSPDGRFVAVGIISSVNSLFIYSFNRVANSLTLLIQLNPEHGTSADHIDAVNWSPDGQYLAVGGLLYAGASDSNALIVYKFDSSIPSLVPVVFANPQGGTFYDEVFSVKWSPDGNYLAVAGNINFTTGGSNALTIYRFDRIQNTLTPVVSVNPDGGGAQDQGLSVDWSADGQYIAISGLFYGGGLQDVIVYRFDRGSQILNQVAAVNPGGPYDFVYALNWSPDGQYLAVGGDISGNPGYDLVIYRAIQFPTENVIKNNTVYCNSGGQSGVGISGSSICNYIIGNTAYSNPINPTIASFNYIFVCNVYNPLFLNAPTAMQNIALDTCQIIPTPEDEVLLIKQCCANLNARLDFQDILLQSILAVLATKL